MSKVTTRLYIDDKTTSNRTANEEAKILMTLLPKMSFIKSVTFISVNALTGEDIYEVIFDVPMFNDDADLKITHARYTVTDGSYNHEYKLIERLDFQFHNPLKASTTYYPNYTIPNQKYYGLNGVPDPQVTGCDHEYINSQCKKCKAVWV